MSHTHSHAHSHSHASSASTTSALLGLFTNVFLTVAKLAGGYLLNSTSLIADAAHSATDLVADGVTVGFLWVSAPSGKVDASEGAKRWSWGKGKFEPIGTLLVSFLLLSGGLGIGLHSLTLLSPSLPSSLPFSSLFHSHGSSEGEEEEVDARAALFAVFGILVKEWLYQRTARVAIEQKSDLLMASALHHRSDAMSSVVALIAIVGSAVGYKMLDPLGGIVVAAMILHQSYELASESLLQLLDYATDPTLLSAVSQAISSLDLKVSPVAR
ncbi:hypothetical protein BT69DRAFT_360817 [Atractiella rhizophila]|nr:hypothetical protein BT69DRAFT_360817 [Atractiella rhizophila]